MKAMYPTTEGSSCQLLLSSTASTSKSLTEHGEAVEELLVREAQITLESHDPGIPDAVPVLHAR